jgi:hypothetical protein
LLFSSAKCCGITQAVSIEKLVKISLTNNP